MSYTDNLLVADIASGYQTVNDKQWYDAFAAQLATHPAWELVEGPVAFVFNGTTTYLHYVWRNKSAVSGLPNDFYVIFRISVATGGGAYGQARGVDLALAEQYDSSTHIASKCALYPAGNFSQTLSADATNPTTWTLTTAIPATNPNAIAMLGPMTNTDDTWQRVLIVVTNDAILAMWQGHYTAGGVDRPGQLYVGAIETLLSADDDPMPLILAAAGQTGGVSNSMGSWGLFSSPRHPKCGGQTGFGFFGWDPANWNGTLSGTGAGLATGPLFDSVTNSNAGFIGAVGDTQVNLYESGLLPVSKCCIRSHDTPANGATPSTRGGVRGFFKYFRVAQLPWGTAANVGAIGDTFYIDGNPWVSSGSQIQGLMDTTA